MRMNQDDDDIDYNCYVKNLLRFFNKNIARERTDKRIKESCNIENCDYLKMKRDNERLFSLFFLFVLSKSKCFCLRPFLM